MNEEKEEEEKEEKGEKGERGEEGEEGKIDGKNSIVRQLHQLQLALRGPRGQVESIKTKESSSFGNEDTDNEWELNNSSDTSNLAVKIVSMTSSSPVLDSRSSRSNTVSNVSSVGSVGSFGRRRTRTDAKTHRLEVSGGGTLHSTKDVDTSVFPASSCEWEANKPKIPRPPPELAEACLSMELKLAQIEYIGGQSVKGMVMLNLLKPLDRIGAVMVIIQGCEKVWCGDSFDEGKKSKKKGRNYSSSMFFKDCIPVWQTREDGDKLGPGRHTWNFEFPPLPIHLAPTFYFGRYISIFYSARAYCLPFDSFTHSPELLSTLCSNKEVFDIYGVPTPLWDSITTHHTKSQSAGQLLGKSDLRLTLSIPSGDCTIGSPIPLRISVINKSNKEHKAFALKFSLMQLIKIHGQDFSCEFEEISLAQEKVKFGPVPAKEVTCERVFELSTSPSEEEGEMPVSNSTVKEQQILPSNGTDTLHLILPTAFGSLFTISHRICVWFKMHKEAPRTIFVPLHLWDSLWSFGVQDNTDEPFFDLEALSSEDTPPSRPTSEDFGKLSPLYRPSVTLAPSDWRFQTFKVWSKPCPETPLAIDLPRLARRIQLVGFEGRDDTGVFSKYNEMHRNPPSSFHRVLGLICSLVCCLEDPKKCSHLEERFWEEMPFANSNETVESEKVSEKGLVKSSSFSGATDYTRQLRVFLERDLGDESPSLRILKACTQATIAPAVISMSVSIAPKLPFKDGGGWKIRIIFQDNTIVVAHNKKQVQVVSPTIPISKLTSSLPSSSLLVVSSQQTPSLEEDQPQFRFEWELALSFSAPKFSSISDFSFGLVKVSVSEHLSSQRIDEINSVLTAYFKYGPTFQTGPNQKAGRNPTKRFGSHWVAKTSVLDTEDSHGNAIMYVDEEEKKGRSVNWASEQQVSSFYDLPTANALLEMDCSAVSINVGNVDGMGNALQAAANHTKLLHFTNYVDEEEALYEVLESRHVLITLHHKLAQKLRKPFEQLLLANTLPVMYTYCEIESADGLIRTHFSPEDKTLSGLKSFLETLAILSQDTKQTLPALVQHFTPNLEREHVTEHPALESSSFLAKFFANHLHSDSKTAMLLKCLSLSVVSAAYHFLADFFSKKGIPFLDIARSWRVRFKIGLGDGSRADTITITHHKAARSSPRPLGSDVDGFQLLWRLQLVYNFDMDELRKIDLKVVRMQPEFPSQISPGRVKVLTALANAFNRLNHSPRGGHVNVKSTFAVRKKLRAKLHKLPMADLSNPTLLKKCSLRVKVIQSKNIQLPQPKKGSFLFSKTSKKQLPNLFFSLQLEDQHFTTDIVLQNEMPYFGVELLFEVFNPNEQSLKIKGWNKQKDVDIDLGEAEVPIRPDGTNEPRDEWIKLESVSVRLWLHYSEVLCLPLPLYEELQGEFLSHPIYGVKLLDNISREEKGGALLTALKILHENKLAVQTIKELATEEILNTRESELLFRSDSLVSKVVELYFAFIGDNYLADVLSSLLKKISHSGLNCEIDPMQLNGKNREKRQRRHSKNLQNFFEELVERITSTVHLCPTELREIFLQLRTCAIEKWKDPAVGDRAVCSLLFLRLLCPAVISPRKFRLVDECCSDLIGSRSFILLAKALQKLSTFSCFTETSTYMREMNGVICDWMPQLKAFVDAVCQPLTEHRQSTHLIVNYEWELARFHMYLKKCRGQILQMPQNQLTISSKLEAILDGLDYIAMHDKVDIYPLHRMQTIKGLKKKNRRRSLKSS